MDKNLNEAPGRKKTMAEITPVATIYTQFPSKFGIPRQSGLADTAGKIVFNKDFRSIEAVRGMEGFSHLWLIWEFSENKNKSNALTVRPPRLGGNTRMGVFATRSSFRPNNLGLSAVRIEKIDYECSDAPVIYVRGADILDGTPIFDIKPYLPFSDCIPEAKGGFADDVSGNNMNVEFPPEIINEADAEDIPLIREILSEDPRPHYHNDPDRIYSFEFSSYKIKFTVKENTVYINEIKKLPL